MNNAVIEGNLTRDPEMRFTNGGKGVCSFGVAVNRKWTNNLTNETQEEVSFFDCVAWEPLAENVADSLHKGDRVLVTGRLQQRSWETDGGEKRSKVELVADCVGPALRWAKVEITRNERGSGSGGAPASAAAAADYDNGEPF